MDTASWSTATTLSVRKDTVPKNMLVPLFSTMAAPITVRNNTGSNQDVVVTQRIRKINTTASVMISLIS